MRKYRNCFHVVIAAFLLITGSNTLAADSLPADPLNSVMWDNMAQRFFPGKVVIDQRVVVSAPHDAEDQMQVPITVDATQLEGVKEIVAVADLNPIPHILTLRPLRAQPFIGFRVKLEQATPIRVGVRTADDVWHVNGVIVNAAGGGCSAPALAHGTNNWYQTLGQTRAITRRETADLARLSLRMRHPMDTGLAPGIPVFYMNEIEVKSSEGTVLANIEMFEPISENPTLTLKPLVNDNVDELLVYARDTEANEFRFSLPVPKTWAVHGRTEYFTLENGGNIVNVAFIEVPDGVVVIDTGPSRRYGEALLSLIKNTIPGKEVLRVYNTHHHPDHFLGNQVFENSIIAAPQQVIDNIVAEGDGFADNMYRLVGDWMRGTYSAAPGKAIETDSEEIGGRRFSLFYLSGHTSSDLVIRDDETGVLFTGDLAFFNRAPTTPHANIDTWQESLSALSQIDKQLILPGHGLQDSSEGSLVQTADYLDWLQQSLRKATSDGLTMNEAMRIKIPARFQSIDVVQTEFERSVVHLFLSFEDELMPLIELK